MLTFDGAHMQQLCAHVLRLYVYTCLYQFVFVCVFVPILARAERAVPMKRQCDAHGVVALLLGPPNGGRQVVGLCNPIICLSAELGQLNERTLQFVDRRVIEHRPLPHIAFPLTCDAPAILYLPLQRLRCRECVRSVACSHLDFSLERREGVEGVSDYVPVKY